MKGETMHKVHAQADIGRLWSTRWQANNIDELIEAIEKEFGSFPLLFHVAPYADGEPGVVMTGLAHMPGAEVRPDVPFIGAVMRGYLPVQGHRGDALIELGGVKAEKWDSFVKPTQVEKQELVSGEMEG